jgi:1-acyl-sn-glycerol-3-phosphate acyltransferase
MHAVSVPAFVRTISATARITVGTALDGTFGRSDLAERTDRRLDWWSARLREVADMRVTVEGRENFAEDETFVVMSNHQSHFDIPVLYQALQRRLRMVAKKELFRIPLFGRAMRLSGFVEVDRQDRIRAVRALDGARAALDAGTNIWIAPEGTRSETGKLAEFKKGGFHLALGAGARILPVSIDGTKDVLPAHSRDIRRGHSVRVVINPPIDPAAYGPERMTELVTAVREAISAHLPYA